MNHTKNLWLFKSIFCKNYTTRCIYCFCYLFISSCYVMSAQSLVCENKMKRTISHLLTQKNEKKKIQRTNTKRTTAKIAKATSQPKMRRKCKKNHKTFSHIMLTLCTPAHLPINDSSAIWDIHKICMFPYHLAFLISLKLILPLLHSFYFLVLFHKKSSIASAISIRSFIATNKKLFKE